MGLTFPNLFQPGKIGTVELKNRLVMAPMGIGALVAFDGTFSEGAIDYYEARAKGGIGLIITTVCLATNKYESWEVNGLKLLPTFDNPAKVRNFKQLTERIQEHRCRIFVQLTAGWGRIYRPRLAEMTGHKAFAPSPTPLFWAPHLNAREMTIEEIEELVEEIGKAALIAREAGFDGVELHGHEGYLLDQFKTSLWNWRMDKFGGDLLGRMRFPLAIIKKIKEAAGEDFPIVYQYGLEHKIEGGRTREEGLQIAQVLERAGVSALHVDVGCYENWYWPHPPEYQPPACMVEMAELVKKQVDVPVITVGRLGYPSLANEVVEKKRADFIALGRPLLADPDFPNKARKGQLEDIRPCIGCHECFRRLYENKSISCSVNPSCGNERRLEIRKAETPKRVMVIGGGIAGMEAARVCAMRGHQVKLYEKNKSLGGLLCSVSRHSLKNDIKKLLDYQIRQLVKPNVEIKLETEVDIEIIKNDIPDIVLVATGSLPLESIDGKEGEKINTFSSVDVLDGNVKLGLSVVVIGGGSAGCEIAYELANQNRNVTIIEQLPELASDLHHANRTMLLELLEKKGVKILANCKVENVISGIVKYKLQDGIKGEIKTDSIILTVGRRSINEITNQINELVDEIYEIGDCIKPRKIKDAIWEAYKTSINL